MKITLTIADPDHAILAVRLATTFARRDDLPRPRPRQCVIYAYCDDGTHGEVAFAVWGSAEHVHVQGA